MKECADDNFELGINGRKFSNQVENNVVKGEIAVTSNFSFSHSVFKGLVLQTRKNQSLFGKGFNTDELKFVLSGRVNANLSTVEEKFKLDENGEKLSKRDRKHCGKRKYCSLNEQLLFYPLCFQKNYFADT